MFKNFKCTFSSIVNFLLSKNVDRFNQISDNPEHNFSHAEDADPSE